jgi:hypothetical protein
MNDFIVGHPLLEFNIEIENNVVDIKNELELLLSCLHCIQTCDNMMRIKIDTDMDGYYIKWNNSTYYGLQNKSDLLWVLNEILFDQVLTETDGWAFLHAGAVICEEKLLVFLADSNMGKSTFVTAMCANGSTYLSDDVVPLNTKLKYVTSYCKPIAIRNTKIIERYLETNMFHESSINITYNNQRKCLYFPTRTVSNDQTWPIHAIIFLHRDPLHKTPILCELSRSKGATNLMKKFIHTSVEKVPSLSMFLAKELPFYELHYAGIELIKSIPNLFCDVI